MSRRAPRRSCRADDVEPSASAASPEFDSRRPESPPPTPGFIGVDGTRAAHASRTGPPRSVRDDVWMDDWAASRSGLAFPRQRNSSRELAVSGAQRSTRESSIYTQLSAAGGPAPTLRHRRLRPPVAGRPTDTAAGRPGPAAARGAGQPGLALRRPTRPPPPCLPVSTGASMSARVKLGSAVRDFLLDCGSGRVRTNKKFQESARRSIMVRPPALAAWLQRGHGTINTIHILSENENL